MKRIVMAVALLVSGMVSAADHRIVIHVDENDPKKMNLALNNAANVDKYYKDKGEEVQIEVVAYGPGMIMFHKKKSPVAERIKSFGQNFENIGFRACANTMAKMKKKSGKDVPLLSEAVIVPSGVIQIMTRQEEGWSYLRP